MHPEFQVERRLANHILTLVPEGFYEGIIDLHDHTIRNPHDTVDCRTVLERRSEENVPYTRNCILPLHPAGPCIPFGTLAHSRQNITCMKGKKPISRL